MREEGIAIEKTHEKRLSMLKQKPLSGGPHKGVTACRLETPIALLTSGEPEQGLHSEAETPEAQDSQLSKHVRKAESPQGQQPGEVCDGN